MLEEVDKPGSEIDLYVDSQEEILDSKLQEIEQMKKALNLFKNNLKEEQTLSKICNSRIQTANTTGNESEQKYKQFNLMSDLNHIMDNNDLLSPK